MARTALITGSTSGIGAGIAEALARAGCNVVLNGLGAGGEIEALRARLAQEHGVDVRYDGADMTRPAEIAAMVERAVAAFGAVDVLVNNAGIQHVAAVDEFPVERWDAILAVNLSSAFHTTRAALPAMRRNGWGRIVNVASAHALVASPFKSAYVAAKHGLAGFTKCVALEVAQAGITVNAICPGYVRTPLVDAQIPDQARTRGISEEEVVQKIMLAGQPTKRFVGIDEVAALAVYLASDAAQSITGAVLPIDGGWTAQ
ncbi:MAG: 3-hydroxybutyrate dehydrogenase [Burkholderiales bacterium]|nr:3-hydroxybutyrate dehydrogenase [Burkholderiales bacterium]GIK87310.1 MAG: 3-hydroxybutyrate dehydrogenase [Betaproteobacteria bacterium]